MSTHLSPTRPTQMPCALQPILLRAQSAPGSFATSLTLTPPSARLTPVPRSTYPTPASSPAALMFHPPPAHPSPPALEASPPHLRTDRHRRASVQPIRTIGAPRCP
jgi:hypothetical protein